MANLAADLVFLLIQGPLFLPGDMAAVLRRHHALFSSDLVIFLMQVTGLLRGDLAFPALLVDALVLVGQPPVDLGTARMILIPVGLRKGGAGRNHQKGGETGEQTVVHRGTPLHSDGWTRLAVAAADRSLAAPTMFRHLYDVQSWRHDEEDKAFCAKFDRSYRTRLFKVLSYRTLRLSADLAYTIRQKKGAKGYRLKACLLGNMDSGPREGQAALSTGVSFPFGEKYTEAEGLFHGQLISHAATRSFTGPGDR